MKKYSILIVIVVIFGWTIFDFVQSDDMEESELDELESEEDGWMVSSESVQENPDESTVGLNIGSMAPDFELKNLEGETVKLSDYRGQKVMLNFWATWCPPCRAEMPDMQKFYEEKDVVILGVDLFDTETSLNAIEEFSNKHQ
ncbi:peroxiredoxin family protein, partial [Piscibacillus halophilus]|uniref:peroxiredoxin family protein n=1 Tax=Piscibacillus halophilus TaxID=571933 RepID=UPI0015887379